MIPTIRSRVISNAFIGLLATAATPACDVATPPEAPDPAACSLAWRTIYSPPQELFGLRPSSLVWHSGQVYFGREADHVGMIAAIPDTGGPLSTVSDQAPFGTMWAEDDHLVFLGEGGLYRAPFVPSAGGATEPIIARDSLLFAGAWALDRDALYWTREGEVSVTSDPWNVWRTPRDGGDDQIVSVISDSQFNFYDRLVSLPDRLIVYSDITFSRAPAWSIPKAGGDAVALPSLDKGTVIGVGHDGAVFSYRGNAGIESTRFEVARWLPGDAAVQPFWTSKPPAAQPSTFWSDGVGGGIVVATEPTNDGLTHVSVWAVDSAGNGRRLACDPEVAREVLTGVVGPDAVYLAMTSAGGSYWQLVAVSRAGS